MYSFLANHIEPLSYLICLITYGLIFRKDKSTRIKVLFIFFLLAFISMAYCSHLLSNNIPNISIYNLCLLPLSILFLHVYFFNVPFGKLKRKITFLLFFVNLIVFIATTFFSKQAVFFNSISFATLGFSITVYCFFFFHERLKNVTETNIYDSIDFWIICGLFISFSGSFIVFLTYHYLTIKISEHFTDEDANLLTVLWMVPNIFLFINSLISLTGYIWVYYRRKFIS